MRTMMIAVLIGLAVAACSGSPEPAAPNATSTTTAPRVVGTPSTVDRTGPSEAVAECLETRGWDTGPKEAAPYSTDALYLVRAGQHECFDRVVFDVNGAAAVGYSVRYVPVVAEDGSGKPMPVPGSAALEVVVHAPEQGYDDSGHQPGVVLARSGDYFYTESQLAGWRSLRAVRFAGFFEGQCTIAVGVAETLPFTVSTSLDGATRHVVVDVAHPVRK
ncbi:MAG TPA: hypothetical protein VGR06_35000 [Actinophytocola sp.]|uniref:AMIN-like domain-containing (lipo)protein n=1 Tax=Actinophytocola sp. TaxID=1872138 RepID=UPI002DF887FD|nr:hypothetical protein [Actinophytocola sp.]